MDFEYGFQSKKLEHQEFQLLVKHIQNTKPNVYPSVIVDKLISEPDVCLTGNILHSSSEMRIRIDIFILNSNIDLFRKVYHYLTNIYDEVSVYFRGGCAIIFTEDIKQFGNGIGNEKSYYKIKLTNFRNACHFVHNRDLDYLQCCVNMGTSISTNLYQEVMSSGIINFRSRELSYNRITKALREGYRVNPEFFQSIFTNKTYVSTTNNGDAVYCISTRILPIPQDEDEIIFNEDDRDFSIGRYLINKNFVRLRNPHNFFIPEVNLEGPEEFIDLSIPYLIPFQNEEFLPCDDDDRYISYSKHLNLEIDSLEGLMKNLLFE